MSKLQICMAVVNVDGVAVMQSGMMGVLMQATLDDELQPW